MARHVTIVGPVAGRPAPTETTTDFAPQALVPPPARPAVSLPQPTVVVPPAPLPSGLGGAGPTRSSPVRRRRRRRTPWPIPTLAVVTLTLALVVELGNPVPKVTLVFAHRPPVVIGGTAPPLPWPTTGQAALAVPAAGLVVSPAPEAPAPIASLTKMMTALVVLHDHPISASAPGPHVVMTMADQQDAAADSAGNDTQIPVTAGEALTERQLLDGLLVHSANDFADALAVWDAGSLSAFVAKMNAAAASLGMTNTRYVDPSGLSTGDASTAIDQLKVATAAMAIPAFAAVVAQPAITEPGAGLLSNYVSVVGTQGVVGVKSGFTQAAMGCLVLAVNRQVDGRTVLILTVLTGQQGGDPLGAAASGGLALANAVVGGLRLETLAPAHHVEGSLSAPWTNRRLTLMTKSALTVWAWPGTRWTTTMTRRQVVGDIGAGQAVATLTVSDGSHQVATAVVSSGPLDQPSLSWRITH